MTPRRLTLTGFHGIKSGLGLDTITLDLTGEEQTIAIKGDNGSGKSTIMTWGLVPHREPPGMSPYDATYGEALRELDFEHGGQIYRSRIEISEKARKMKAVLMSAVCTDVLGTSFASVRLPDGTTSDGKNGTYDACLEHLLGPQDLYFLSAFQGQSTARLSDHADPKGLLSKLLNLGEIEQLSDRARQVTRGFKDRLTAMRGDLDRVARLERTIQEQVGKIMSLDGQIPTVKESLSVADQALESARDAYRTATDACAGNAIISQRRADLAKRLVDLCTEMDAARERRDRAVSVSRDACAKTTSENDARIAGLKREITAANVRSVRADQVLAEGNAIRFAANDLPMAQESLDCAAHRLLELQEEKDTWDRLKKIQEKRRHDLLVQEVGVREMVRRGKDLLTQASFRLSVPCQATDGGGFFEGYCSSIRVDFTGCPALKGSFAAKDDLDALQPVITQATDAANSLSLEIMEHHAEIDAGEDLPNRILDQTRAMKECRQDVDRMRVLAARAGELAQAQENKAHAEAEISRKYLEISAVSDLTCQAEIDYVNITRELHAELAGVENQFDQNVKQVNADIEALSPLASDRAATLAQDEEKRCAKIRDDAEQHLRDINATLSVARAGKKAAEEDLATAQGIRDKAGVLEREITLWSLLSAGLRGVIDLTIEDAGPTIAATANHLLAAAYGDRFRIRIETQKTRMNGNVAETFDISVWDSETGTESPIGRKSGGQRVWLNQALAGAVAIYFKESSGIDYETMITDELDDGLTESNKLLLYRMGRKAMELGGYRKWIFVSHFNGAWDLADRVIDLDSMKINS